MDTTPDRQQINPDEARAALEQAAAARVSRPHDRGVYAGTLAALGLAFGLFGALSRGIGPAGGPDYLDLIELVVLLAVVYWQRRGTSSVPLGAKRVGYVGLGATLAVSLATTMVLNYRDLTTPRQAGVLVLVGVLVALPLVVSGVVVRRGRR